MHNYGDCCNSVLCDGACDSCDCCNSVLCDGVIVV